MTLFVQQDGAGPPIILIPGLLSDSASWGPLVAPLCANHHLIRPDNRGTGQSALGDAPLTVRAMANDLLAVMDRLGLTSAHIVGHSMGGLIGQTIATLQPDRVVGLTLLACAPKMPLRNLSVFETLTELRRQTQDNDPGLWLKALYPWLFHPRFFDDPANTDAAIAATLAYPHMQSVDHMQVQIEALRNPDIPTGLLPENTQVLLAENDLLISVDDASRQWQDLGARVSVIQDAGHSIHWDQPTRVAQAILNAIEKSKTS